MVPPKLLRPITPVSYHRDCEERIEVHVFLCVAGMILVRYTAGRLKMPGVKLLRSWNEVGRLRVVLVKDWRRKQAPFMVEELRAMQAFDRLSLSRYVS